MHKNTRLFLSILLAAGLAHGQASAQTQPQAPDSQAGAQTQSGTSQAEGPRRFPCQVFAVEQVQLASPIVGVLAEVMVERGDRVTKGQIVARLHDEVEQARVALAEAKASADAQLKAKQAHLAFADRTLSRNAPLVKQNYVSASDVDQMRTDRDIAALDAAAAAETIVLAKRELDEARAELELHTLRSPIDGVVTRRRLNAGEATRDQPVLDIARIDRLDVEVALPTAYIGRVVVGSVGTLKFDVPGAASRTEKVSLIDPVVDAASNMFGVRFRIDNKDGKIPAGIKCSVGFQDAP